MPNTYTRKKTYTKKQAYTARRGKKKTNRRRRKRNKMDKATVNTMHPLIAPDRARVKLKYQERISITPSTLGTSLYEFRGNGPYDPNVTGVGGQPTGWDEWTALYKRCLVRASKIRIEVMSVDGTDTDKENLEFAIMPAGGSSYLTSDTQEIGVLPYGKFRLMYFGADGNPTNNVITSYMSTAKIFGQSAASISAEKDYQSLVTTTPSLQWYWDVYYQPADEASSETYLMYVTISYYCEFWERIILSPSLISEGLQFMKKRYDEIQDRKSSPTELKSLPDNHDNTSGS